MSGEIIAAIIGVVGTLFGGGALAWTSRISTTQRDYHGRLVALETWEKKQNGSLQSLEKKVDDGFDKLDRKLERLLHNPK